MVPDKKRHDETRCCNYYKYICHPIKMASYEIRGKGAILIYQKMVSCERYGKETTLYHLVKKKTAGHKE